jgi:lipopolysaccharide/colanic/teichoic acid biosynthesis glycosyltransferase
VAAAHRVKVLLDPVLAAILLLLSSPLLVALAVGVRASSSGPVLFRRRVLGRNGRDFDALKLRTMVEDADRILREDAELAAAHSVNVKLQNDPRVTSFGRFLRRSSLDELPQLWNVVRGEMSLVGPRIITREEGERFGAALARRLSVRPGLTGLWQVRGRQELDYDRRIALDLEYIESWSLWLDLKILLATIPVVLGRRGAY